MTDSEVVGEGETRGRFSEQAKDGEKDRREMEKTQRAKGDDDGGKGRGEREREIRDEPFRKTDVVSFGCQGHFIGEGPQGYLHACIWLAQLLRTDGSSKAHIVM